MEPMGDVLHLLVILSFLETGNAKVKDFKAAGATAPGDIIIGGLFSIHEGVEESLNLSAPHASQCVRFNTDGFTRALAMIHAIELANRSPVLTTLGISLGYRIHDSCSDVTTTLRASADFTQPTTDCGGGANTSNSSPPIMAIIGASSSEISISIARQLNLELIPQISYASTAIILGDKIRFPAFLRTVPSDLYQTRAMVRLLSDSKWTWVGMVTTDGDYGRSAMESFVSQATASGICVAFKEILPDSLTSPDINSAVRNASNTIRSNPKVKVVVTFAKPTHMTYLYRELRGQRLGSGLGERVWVASDSWSSSKEALGEMDLPDIGHVVGFTFKRGNLAPFHHYLMNLSDSNDVIRNNSFLKEFYSLLNGSGDPGVVSSSTAAAEILLNNSHAGIVFSVEMAVSAIAHAVADICSKKDCKTAGTVQPWKVLQALRGSRFELEGKSYMFDQKGDINLGYDVTVWRSVRGVINVSDVVAEYHPINNSFSYTSRHTTNITDLKDVVSVCSASCKPGEFKKTAEGQHTCCYECINCTENHYSNNTDMDQCLSCDTKREWSLEGSSWCTHKTLEFFSWQDGFAVVLLALAALGIILVLLVGALFLHQHQTPVVKAAGGPLSQLMLLSLVGSFVSAVFFVGHPSSLQCKTRQVLFGLSFTLCVSCILVKSLKILLAFQLNPDLKDVLRRLYQPYAIICLCVALQVLTCTLWLVLQSPWDKATVFATTVLAECDEGSYMAFGVMLGYIAVLALVCFACAFKGRKLPQNYNEARFITFSMLLYLMSWVIFVPVYVTTSGKYLPAVEMVVILISNYGILSCHFFPKCYIILFKKEHNTKSAFMKNVQDFSFKSITDSSSVSETSVSQTEGKCTSHTYSISSPFFCMSPPPIETTAPQNFWSVGQNIQSIDIATHCTIVDHGVFVTGQLTRPYRLRRSMSL
ncbi:G-protein coupled receptor family C group 6 member A-like [Coregonus clupeaformis]|uniref:G-protein coupled receptor family C group 6 member A-like n=1 Tax=Coregonus clupeaformis TaxID=59861 RepID=UPI001E1C3025|nr:G-protein coupled receptor family C group 6 member A-like [Coregonus clupeaformis]